MMKIITHSPLLMGHYLKKSTIISFFTVAVMRQVDRLLSFLKLGLVVSLFWPFLDSLCYVFLSLNTGFEAQIERRGDLTNR